MSDTRDVCLPIIEATFLEFGYRHKVVGETPDAISLAVAYVGGPCPRLALWAALQHDIESKTHGAFTVSKWDITEPRARLIVERRFAP